jgi:hypothetical protein
MLRRRASLDFFGHPEGLGHGALPHVPAEDEPRRPGFHHQTGPVQQIGIADAAAPGEEDETVPGGADDFLDRRALVELQLRVRLGRALPGPLVDRGHVELDDIGPEFRRHPGRVVHRKQAVAAALLLDGFAPRISPDEQRHPEPVAVRPHAA